MTTADEKQAPRQDIHNSDIPKVCQACEARHGGVCGALTPQQLIALSKHTRIVEVAAGATLLTENEDIEVYANILRGVVKLSKLLEDGRQQIVGLQFPPDLLGRQHTDVSTVTAEAAVDTKLCIFPRHAIESAASESRGFAGRLQAQALRELDSARDWMLTLGRRTAYEKVASLLLLVATASDPEQFSPAIEDAAPTRLQMPLSRADMADFLGLTTETVSRQITALRTKGIISLESADVVCVLDASALRAAAGC